MEIRPIHTPADHRAALREISHLVESRPGPPARRKATPWRFWPRWWKPTRHATFRSASPIRMEAIKFRMEQAGLTPQKDLQPQIGAGWVFLEAHARAAALDRLAADDPPPATPTNAASPRKA